MSLVLSRMTLGLSAVGGAAPSTAGQPIGLLLILTKAD
jgi:hypothetical protein